MRLLSALLISIVFTVGFPKGLSVQAQAANLVANPGFENAGQGWGSCGEAELIDAQAASVDDHLVSAGRYAGRVAYSSSGACGSAFFDPIGALAYPISIPEDATHLSVSFRYRRVGTNLFPMQIIVGDSWSYSGNNTRLAFVEADDLPGWNLYRSELTAADLSRIRQASGQVSLYFAVFVGGGLSTYTDPQPPIGTPGFYIDDVHVTTAIERTTESPLPAELASNDTRPIVYVSGTLGGVARINTDGSGAQLVSTGQTSSPLSPIWSPDGRQIATIQNALVPAHNTDLTINPAFISIVYRMDGNGYAAQEIFRTTGTPGREPLFPTPSEPRIAALDMKITSMDFSPDGSLLAMTICSNNRYRNGETSDSICFVKLHTIATGQELEQRNEVIRPSWGSNGLILYEDNDNYGQHEDGIWQYNRQAEQLLLPGTGAQFKPSLRQERWPSWSPDGSRFATIRDVSGYHQEGDTYIYHDAIQVYDRTGQLGGTVLLIDHGSITGGLSWSPDGKYLLYSLTQGKATDIWWLDVGNGTTGKVTHDGASIAADWRPVNAGAASLVFLPLVLGP